MITLSYATAIVYAVTCILIGLWASWMLSIIFKENEEEK